MTNPLRNRRNEIIYERYRELHAKKKLDGRYTKQYCLLEIYNSEENKAWCLGMKTLSLIVSDKRYGSRVDEKKK